MFFFKRSKIHIDCFIADELIYNNFKIDTANKFTPKEWRQFPPYITKKANDNPNSKLTVQMETFKKCRGIVDLFSVWFILPCWADVQLEMFDVGKFNITGFNSPNAAIAVGYHGREQYGDEIYKNFAQLKFESPWFLREKTGVQFTWNPCMWHDTNQKENVQILSAVVDFHYQMSTNVNMFIKKGSISKFNAGDPLVHMIPISDKKVKLHHHLLTHEEYQRKIQVETQSTMYWQPRRLKGSREGKCPFGFGR